MTITPTEDGILIDCRGNFDLWGCGCSHCLPRRHPLDIGARLSRRQKQDWGEMSMAISRSVTVKCVSCERDGRLYAGGRFCDDHVPGRKRGTSSAGSQ